MEGVSRLQPKQFPQQLQMLMKPSEIVAQPNFVFGDLDESESLEAMRRRKLDEADSGDQRWLKDKRTPLSEQVRTEGVREPLTMHQGYDRWGSKPPGPLLADGHHRYFVQERRERQGEEVYLPVEHHEW